MQKAIDSDCEIVVFPELVVSPGYIERIQSQLRSISDTRELQLVVAGSGWEPSEDGCFGKNVCHVLDKEGRVQARTTKKFLI